MKISKKEIDFLLTAFDIIPEEDFLKHKLIVRILSRLGAMKEKTINLKPPKNAKHLPKTI